MCQQAPTQSPILATSSSHMVALRRASQAGVATHLQQKLALSGLVHRRPYSVQSHLCHVALDPQAPCKDRSQHLRLSRTPNYGMVAVQHSAANCGPVPSAFSGLLALQNHVDFQHLDSLFVQNLYELWISRHRAGPNQDQLAAVPTVVTEALRSYLSSPKQGKRDR